ncbi:MFS transporter [Cupriavidus sp. TA19]|uniref:Bug family tripartite tricarboxylate transporter substrate binding protein n=1 Tax=unclassified Cupriavidus TaxID=2640874 RepID=UPI000E2E43F4|nr:MULTISPECIES: tripartite tricarboxylate transporter substrate binding protein [unclassified Cupriavidus]BDB29589.1 tripartite tricarboxylate transporter substrate binding protein [Cupriavidus sp. P-10]GLC97436.1 MFS transporter [Cupriavidus sp. TA19]
MNLRSVTASRRHLVGSALLALAAMLSTTMSQANDVYPSKTIRIVVGFAPGGGADIVARQIGAQLSKQLGQSVIVENRPGATGTIAATNVSQSSADGYSLMLASQSTMVIAPSMYSRLPFDPIKDFKPVTQLVSMPLVMVVHPSVPAGSVKDVIALARVGKLASYASSGPGGPQHIAGELFNTMSGIKLTHVPYKGESAALTDVIAGTVPVMFANVPVVAPFIKSGKLKAIAVSSQNRAPGLPNVPTVAESGLKNFEVSTWYGLFAPANTPVAVVQKLSDEVTIALKQPELRAKFAEQGLAILGTSPAQFGKFMTAEVPKWAGVVKSANIQAE